MRLPGPMSDALSAVSLLTVVPTGVGAPSAERTGVAGWMPLVGLGIGGLTAVAVGILPNGYRADHALLLAALIAAAQAAFTRLLHWDGLADVADAWWGGASHERRLEIMKDSATGAFGVSAVVLFAVLQIAALTDVLGGASDASLAPLIVVPALSRFAATFAAWLGRPARTSGLGRTIMGPPEPVSGAAAALVLAACGTIAWGMNGVFGGALVAAGLAVALVVPHLTAGRMGGVTGDVMGASVVVTETLLYVVAALAGWGVG